MENPAYPDASTTSDADADWIDASLDTPKHNGDWFDVVNNEDVVADHKPSSDSDASSDYDDYPDAVTGTNPLCTDESQLIEVSAPLISPRQPTGTGPISGVFYHTTGGPVYASFHPDVHRLPDPALSFLPEPVTITASAVGLLCCRGRRSHLFYICNPYTGAWVDIPAANNDHGDSIAVVLIPDKINEIVDYHIVVVYSIIERDVSFGKGIYGIEFFDSRRWRWRASKLIIDSDKEKIVPESGVPGGGVACWRTEMGTVVIYVPDTDELMVTVPADDAVRWELGEIGGMMCCITLKGTTAMIWVMEGIDRWEPERLMEVGPDWRVLNTRNLPSPIRSQGGSELLFWEGVTWGDGRHVVARDMATGGARRLTGLSGFVDPQPEDTLVPYVCSDFALRREKIDMEEEEECREKIYIRGDNEGQKKIEFFNREEVDIRGHEKDQKKISPFNKEKRDMERDEGVKKIHTFNREKIDLERDEEGGKKVHTYNRERFDTEGSSFNKERKGDDEGGKKVHPKEIDGLKMLGIEYLDVDLDDDSDEDISKPQVLHPSTSPSSKRKKDECDVTNIDRIEGSTPAKQRCGFALDYSDLDLLDDDSDEDISKPQVLHPSTSPSSKRKKDECDVTNIDRIEGSTSAKQRCGFALDYSDLDLLDDDSDEDISKPQVLHPSTSPSSKRKKDECDVTNIDRIEGSRPAKQRCGIALDYSDLDLLTDFSYEESNPKDDLTGSTADRYTDGDRSEVVEDKHSSGEYLGH